MFVTIFMVFAATSCRVHRSLGITRDEYPFVDYTKSISEEHFPVGQSLVIVLPLAEDTTNKEVSSLIKELHTLGRWPLLVVNATCEKEANKCIETHKHGSYIILTSGPCHEWHTYFTFLATAVKDMSR
jgi:hypothetical protein